MFDLILLDNKIRALRKHVGRSYKLYLFTGESMYFKVTGIEIREYHIWIHGHDDEGLKRSFRIMEVESMIDN
jgi:hypothetical protein